MNIDLGDQALPSGFMNNRRHRRRTNSDERLAAFESPTFTGLWPGQQQDLAAYAQHHLDTTDLAIEMPTGEGKPAGAADR